MVQVEKNNSEDLISCVRYVIDSSYFALMLASQNGSRTIQDIGYLNLTQHCAYTGTYKQLLLEMRLVCVHRSRYSIHLLTLELQAEKVLLRQLRSNLTAYHWTDRL